MTTKSKPASHTSTHTTHSTHAAHAAQSTSESHAASTHAPAPASTPIPASIMATPPATAAPTTASAASSGTSTLGGAALITNAGEQTAHRSKVDVQTQFTSLIHGLLTNYAPSDTFHTSQGTFTRDGLVAEAQSFVTVFEDTKTANQAWRAAVQKERSAIANARLLRRSVKGIVQARFGVDGAEMLQFGFSIPKQPKKTAATKAVAAEKSKATRTARNTMGSVQKKKVKGDVQVALVVTQGAGSAGAAPAGAQLGVTASAPPAAAASVVATGTAAAAATPPVAGAPAGAQGAAAAAPSGGAGH